MLSIHLPRSFDLFTMDLIGAASTERQKSSLIISIINVLDIPSDSWNKVREIYHL